MVREIRYGITLRSMYIIRACFKHAALMCLKVNITVTLVQQKRMEEECCF